jgi:hypothetical protein
MQPLIGIVGGYGAVGRVVARRMHLGRSCHLRLGGRHHGQAERFVRDALDGQAEVVRVDGNDHQSLHSFCARCRVVVNCAGSSLKTGRAIAEATIDAGADYVDLSGDHMLMERLGALSLKSRRRIAVLSAGLMPGLSGLLPRYLAQHFDTSERLTVYIGVLDRFSRGAATDYVEGLNESEPRAAWLGGARVSRALNRLLDVELPFFPSRVTAYPYLSREGERAARQLGLEQSYWYIVFDGRHVPAVLTRFAAGSRAELDVGEVAFHLMEAAELDVAGRTPYQLLLFEIHGKRNGRAVTKSLILSGRGTAEITGTTAALAVDAVLDGHIVSGSHFADEALNAITVVDALRAVPAVARLELVDGSLSQAAVVEDGEL